jgi:nucleoside phosphorylase/CheY-like chemotaxis protein
VRILVVEDQPEKLRYIYQCLEAVGVSGSELEECRDTTEAKRRLESRKYDLLIIDIAVPIRPDVEASPKEGIRLLEEISETDLYIVPDHIVGLTAFEELRAAAEVTFKERGWSVIYYSLESNDWQRQLQAKAEHILSVVRSERNVSTEYLSDLAVVCALGDVELGALRRIAWQWQRADPKNDHSVYYRGEFRGNGATSRIAYAGGAARMGMAAASILATKMIERFRPRFLCIMGIAAGIRGRVNLGDIVAVDRAFDYGSGKFAVVSGRSRFLIEPQHLQLDATLRSRFLLLGEDHEWLARVKHEWPAESVDYELKLSLGPLASGAAVLADQRITARVVEQDRKLLGVDMETYGVFAAAEEATGPRPTVFALKSICDFADEEKDDSYQRYAAYTSAKALARFAELYI